MDGPLAIAARGECEDFIKAYLKYNIMERDLENYEILETKVLDINQFIEKKVEAPLVPTGQQELEEK